MNHHQIKEIKIKKEEDISMKNNNFCKYLFLFALIQSIVYSMSSWDIQLHNKKSLSIRLVAGKSISDYKSNMSGGTSLRYISKPINISIQRWKNSNNIYTNDISISHTFFIDQSNFINAGFMYWDWDYAKDFYWSGPNRNYWVGYIKKIYLDKRVQLTADFNCNYIDTNSSSWRATEIWLNIIYSINNFNIKPYIGWYKQEGYSTSSSVGLSLIYNYFL